MRRQGTNDADEANGGPSEAVMMSIAEIATRDGVSKPTVSVAVKRLVERHNLTVRRDRQGRVALVNVAQYDRLRGAHGDLGKAQTPAAVAARSGEPDHGRPSSDPVYTREQTRNMAYSAELKRLDIEERLGRLVPVDRVREDAQRVAAPIVSAMERLPNRAEEVVAAVQRDGLAGARTWLKSLVHDLRNEVADQLGHLVAELEAQPRRLLSEFPDGELTARAPEA